MRVTELWRHPVKSFQGERLDEADLTADGVAGDREWGVRDQSTGLILTGRRQPELLLAAARLGPVITMPDGTELDGPGAATDKALSDWLGKPVALVAAADFDTGQKGEFFESATDDTSRPLQWTMPPGRFVDAMPVLLLTTASLRTGQSLHPDGDWSSRRFRPNVVVDVEDEGFAEDDWKGVAVALGTAVVTPKAQCERCTMVTRPQPGLGRDLDVYRTLARHHGGRFGMWSAVTTPGRVAVGDEVRVGEM